MNKQPIIVEFVNPPIPTRMFDYSATRDGYEPGCPIGYGETKEASIKDLLEWEEIV